MILQSSWLLEYRYIKLHLAIIYLLIGVIRPLFCNFWYVTLYAHYFIFCFLWFYVLGFDPLAFLSCFYFSFWKKGIILVCLFFFRRLYIVSKALGSVAHTFSFHKLLRITNSRFQVEFRTLSTSDPLRLLLCCSCLILNFCLHCVPYQVRWWFCLWSSDLWGEKQQTVPQPDGHPSCCPHSSSPDGLLVSFLSVWRTGVNNSFRTDLMAIGCLLFYFILPYVLKNVFAWYGVCWLHLLSAL